MGWRNAEAVANMQNLFCETIGGNHDQYPKDIVSVHYGILTERHAEIELRNGEGVNDFKGLFVGPKGVQL